LYLKCDFLGFTKFAISNATYLYRYAAAKLFNAFRIKVSDISASIAEVGLCTLNEVDP
jgi:hypothetical protein